MVGSGGAPERKRHTKEGGSGHRTAKEKDKAAEKGGKHKAAGALEAAATARTWPQERVHKEAGGESSACPRCGKEETDLHRIWECKGYQKHADMERTEKLAKIAIKEAHLCPILWLRGIPPKGMTDTTEAKGTAPSYWIGLAEHAVATWIEEGVRIDDDEQEEEKREAETWMTSRRQTKAKGGRGSDDNDKNNEGTKTKSPVAILAQGSSEQKTEDENTKGGEGKDATEEEDTKQEKGRGNEEKEAAEEKTRGGRGSDATEEEKKRQEQGRGREKKKAMEESSKSWPGWSPFVPSGQAIMRASMEEARDR